MAKKSSPLPSALLLLLGTLPLLLGGCWPWEGPRPLPTPAPTNTPPKVEEATQQSPPVEGRLLYAREGHIWLRTGTTAHRLTEDLAATQPCWSPDGTQIVFVVKGEGYSDIWVMDAQGNNPHAVTNNQSPHPPHTRQAVYSSYWAFQPQWIPPDGEWIGYISHGTPQSMSGVMSVWRIRPDGSEEHRYLALNGQIESPTWSPDGQVLALAYYPYRQEAQLHYLDPDTGSVLLLGEDEDGVARYDPAWSPDGNWIAYAARKNGRTDLWVMPSPLNPLYEQDPTPVRLTEQGQARAPAWSPTGRQIAFIAGEKDTFDLWLLTLDLPPGGPPRPVKSERLSAGVLLDATARPCWAP